MKRFSGVCPRNSGFTLVEVLVALMVIALGLGALMSAVSGTARTSGYLRDKTLAQWIALNRLSEVRLNVTNKFAQNSDSGDLTFAGRKWHYDTRYFDTTIASMKRIVVRVYPGDAKTKGNPLAESSSFIGTAINPPGSTVSDWTQGNTPTTLTPAGTPGATVPATAPSSTPIVPANPAIGSPGTSLPSSTPE